MMTSSEKPLDAVASVDDVEKLLDELLSQEKEINDKLDHLLNANNQPDLTALEHIQSSLHVDDQIARLWDKIGPTAETASGLSERVKKLDLEQARVKECLKYVEDVEELKVPSASTLLTDSPAFWEYIKPWNDKTGTRRLHFFISLP